MHDEIRILDLFCAEGFAAIGYKKAFPSAHIVGWDVLDMSRRYPYEFNRGDALGLSYEYLAMFDFIHMSPPCQGYSKVTPKKYLKNHKRLIPNALRLGYASGLPFVVENVPGSTIDLRPTFYLSVGTRKRYFHANFEVKSRSWPDVDESVLSTKRKSERMGEWGIPPELQGRMTMKGMRQGIPPMMTEYIGSCLNK